MVYAMGRPWVCVLLVVGLGVGGGVLWLRGAVARLELAEAARGHECQPVRARAARLARLAERWANDDEVLFLLGECEVARGRRDDALAAWAKIPRPSPLLRGPRPAPGHSDQHGKYTRRPRKSCSALARPGLAGPDRYELERASSRLYRFEGRQDDVRRVLRASWGRSPDPAGVLKELLLLDHSPIPAEALQSPWRRRTTRTTGSGWAGRISPCSPAASPTPLGGSIAACSGGPTTPRSGGPGSTWRWRPTIVAGFWAAVAHLPADRFDATTVHALRAWLAAHRGERSLERRELTALLQDAPGDTQALERLAVLTFQAGTDPARRSNSAAARPRSTAPRTGSARSSCSISLDCEPPRSWPSSPDTRPSLSTPRVGPSSRRAGPAPPVAAPESPSESGNSSPLPPGLIDEAVALSAPYATIPGLRGRPDIPTTVAMLADRLEDLRAAAVDALGDHPPRPEPAPAIDHRGRADPAFVDDAEAAGLHFAFDNGQTPQRLLARDDVGGRGAARLRRRRLARRLLRPGRAAPRDGLAPAGPRGRSAPPPGDRLFRNRGDGTFEDVTESIRDRGDRLGRGYGHGRRGRRLR